MAALSDVILSFILMNNRSLISCRVGSMFCAPCFLTAHLTNHNLKVAISFTFVSTVIPPIWFHLRWANPLHLIVIDLLGFLIFNHVRLVAINCPSRVRPSSSMSLQSPHIRFSLKFARIAIWNRNRVVVVASFSLWGINAAFFVQGTSCLIYGLAGTKPQLSLSGRRCFACEYSIPHNFEPCVLMVPLLASLFVGTCPTDLCT